ncbi:S8 family serine peptidase [bacterium SCSIO 12741]|nr:S8 family serine peptidase [bacterium SCSIO 12741]
MSTKWIEHIALLVVLSLTFQTQAQEERKENFSFWAYDALQLPSIDSSQQPYRKIRVAVVDDGFLLTHDLLKGFIVTNSKDIPGNELDDDLNGYKDDFCGWDVSDNDNDVGFPIGRERDFYHGTMVASIITTVAQRVYGDQATKHLEILPVKAVSDYESKTYVKEGYKGIRYALNQKVDIICCAWSGGDLNQEQKQLLEEAAKAGVIIIGSTGRFFHDVLYPAAHSDVLAVSAIDTQWIRIPFANVGEGVDWSTPGIKVRAGHPLEKNAYFYGDGTSASTALMAGCLAVLKSSYPDKTKEELVDALKATSIPLNANNSRYAGKLGAGLPQLQRCVEYLNNPENPAQFFNPRQTEGKMYFGPKFENFDNELVPAGHYKGFVFKVEEGLAKGKTELVIHGGDTVVTITQETANREHFLPGDQATLYTTTQKFKQPIVLSYRPITIDSATLYCDGVVYLNKPSGTITDGSGPDSYANGCDCKWIIRAPEGKRIRFRFEEMDTEGNQDFVWIFEGEKTLEEMLMAKFSGTNRPPELTSVTSTVMLWFLTDNQHTQGGWKMHWEVLD